MSQNNNFTVEYFHCCCSSARFGKKMFRYAYHVYNELIKTDLHIIRNRFSELEKKQEHSSFCFRLILPPFTFFFGVYVFLLWFVHSDLNGESSRGAFSCIIFMFRICAVHFVRITIILMMYHHQIFKYSNFTQNKSKQIVRT